MAAGRSSSGSPQAAAPVAQPPCPDTSPPALLTQHKTQPQSEPHNPLQAEVHNERHLPQQCWHAMLLPDASMHAHMVCEATPDPGFLGNRPRWSSWGPGLLQHPAWKPGSAALLSPTPAGCPCHTRCTCQHACITACSKQWHFSTCQAHFVRPSQGQCMLSMLHKSLTGVTSSGAAASLLMVAHPLWPSCSSEREIPFWHALSMLHGADRSAAWR